MPLLDPQTESLFKDVDKDGNLIPKTQYELDLEFSIITRAQDAIDYARSLGYILEVNLKSDEKPSMGHYQQVIGVRKLRVTSAQVGTEGIFTPDENKEP